MPATVLSLDENAIDLTVGGSTSPEKGTRGINISKNHPGYWSTKGLLFSTFSSARYNWLRMALSK